MASMRIGVVAHQQRSQHVAALSEHVDISSISLDDGTLGCDANHRRAWRSHGTVNELMPHDWYVTLEDDAVPAAPDAQNGMWLALCHAPTPIVSFYLGRDRPPQYQAEIIDAVTQSLINGTHWITSPRLYHAVAIAVRGDKLGLLNAWLESPIGQQGPIDESISGFCQHFGLRVSYTMPSLFNHDDLLPSLAIHPDGETRTAGRRVAHYLGGRAQWNGTYWSIA